MTDLQGRPTEIRGARTGAPGPGPSLHALGRGHGPCWIEAAMFLLLAFFLAVSLPAPATAQVAVAAERDRLQAELDRVAAAIEARKAALPPGGQDRELLRLLQLSQQLANELAALHRAAGERGPSRHDGLTIELHRQPLDDPREARERADLLRDQRDRVLGQIAVVEDRLREARSEEELIRELRDFVTETDLFDDGGRMRPSRGRRAVTANRAGDPAEGEAPAGSGLPESAPPPAEEPVPMGGDEGMPLGEAGLDVDGLGQPEAPSSLPMPPPPPPPAPAPPPSAAEPPPAPPAGAPPPVPPPTGGRGDGPTHRPLDQAHSIHRLPPLAGDETVAELEARKAELKRLATELERRAAELERQGRHLADP